MKPELRVRVGSRNAAKLEAVRRGLAPFFERVYLEGSEVASGVDPQPLGFSEIVRGARNRARRAFELGTCELAAGIEDGLVDLLEVETGWVNVGACVLWDGVREAIGFTAGFEYPPECVRAATGRPRVPIGDAFDSLFRASNGAFDPGSGAGNIGRLTHGALTRADYGAQAVTCAFVRWLHPEFYSVSSGGASE